ncbi:hypothetical protein DVH24_016623 [Malus domestica]|uniref:Uncharacterized protein n=1 Tax=Malus domestica TaxID=3750 RepID=A0A498HX94_MALDO|nr:hypothetical protein DVH24_016623 [Malus domestica]
MASLSSNTDTSVCSSREWVERTLLNLRRRVHSESQLGFLSVINRKPLQKQRPKTRSGTATNGIEDQEPLEPGAVVSELPNAVEAEIYDLFADGVVTAGEVVGGVFLAGNELLRVEKLAVGAGADLVDDGGLQIDEDGARDVLAGTGLGEEGVESVVTAADGLVAGHLAIGANAVLEAVELPAGVANLDSGLPDVDRNALSHFGGRVPTERRQEKEKEEEGGAAFTKTPQTSGGGIGLD